MNSFTTLLNQLVTTLCGVLVPHMMIRAFGSVLYGATTSIAQFLSYISLFEGGVGRAARAELYKPLAEKDTLAVSRVYCAIKRFFSSVGLAFVIYAVILALSYRSIAGLTEISWEYSVLLVLAIAVSTMVDYFMGISNMTLLNADQRKYLYNLAMVASKIINTTAIVVLITCDAELLVVKLASSLVIMLRPLFFHFYVKKHYTFVKVPRKEAVLKNKWDGLGQHFAYFLHTNTDIVLLTLFASLEMVSVYSVYSLVIVSIRSITTSFVGGMEAELGNIIAKKETKELHTVFRRYQCILGVMGLMLMGTAGVMLMPFIRLYMHGVTDANYIQPLFGAVFLLAEGINCLSTPWHTVPISANRLKQTRWGAFGEAGVNIVVSLSLMWWNPLLGVAIGTLAAEVFKTVFYMVYGCKNILHMSTGAEMSRFALNVILLVGACVAGLWITNAVEIPDFAAWILVSIVCAAVCAAVAVGVYFLLFPKNMRLLTRQILKRK